MNRVFGFILGVLMLLVHISAWAGSLGDLYEEKIARSIVTIKSQKDDPKLLEQMIASYDVGLKKCNKQNEFSEKWCPISECDVSPQDCRPDRTLLFRGEDRFFDYPGTSELWRTIKSGSTFADGINIFEMIQKLDFLRQETIAWNKKDDPKYVFPYNYRQFFFMMHTEPSEMIFEDSALKKNVYIDPLISFTINPKRAKGFARMDGEGRFAKVIVLSVPNNRIKSLCDSVLPEPGEIIQSFDCSYALNEYSYENEVDAFLLLEPEYIWKVFTK